MIELVCGKEKKKFTIKQAENVLYIQGQMKLKGWELPKDSQYQYQSNALIKRADTSISKKEAKKADSGESLES